MKSYAEQAGIYAAYHRHPWNRATHFLGVPLIVFAVMLALARVGFAVGATRPSLLEPVLLVLLVYYLRLDAGLGLASAAVLLPMDWLAHQAQVLSDLALAVLCLACFLGGWVFQLVGHAIEGRRPALVDNLFQVFVAPIFLVAEAGALLGLRRRLIFDPFPRGRGKRSPSPPWGRGSG